MRIRQEEYQKTYDAKEQTKKKIEEEKRAAKRAKEAIKEYEQKLKDAERNLKAYENEFRELHRQIDAKRRKLEEEVVVVGAMRKSNLLFIYFQNMFKHRYLHWKLTIRKWHKKNSQKKVGFQKLRKNPRQVLVIIFLQMFCIFLSQLENYCILLADQLAIKANPEDALQNIPKIEIPKHGRKILQGKLLPNCQTKKYIL